MDVGLPFGSRPRLILAHLNREALLTNSPVIEVGRSLTAFVRRIINRPSPNSRDIARFKDQLTRFAAALVRMSVNLPDDRAYQVDTKIIDVMELWLEKNEKQRVLWPEVVELSPRYFESLRAHAVPLDERAIAALSTKYPIALDVYSWLAQRLCRIRPERPQFVSWVNLHDQFGQEFERIRDFRRCFLNVLKLVCTHYYRANIEADKRGLMLRASPPPVRGRLISLSSG